MSKTTAQVIFVNNERYFYKRSPNTGNIMTAWSLAGATMFLPGDEKLIKVTDYLTKIGKTYKVLNVAISN